MKNKDSLVLIAKQLIHIEKEDLTTAEKNILKHLHNAGIVTKSGTESGYYLSRQDKKV